VANSWFKFKQFTIHQNDTAMKVGTDGVLLGAWTKIKTDTQNILDIGTGTGLIALMLAQKTLSSSQIDAVELDQLAYQQAKENFKLSNWSQKLQAINQSIQEFTINTSKKYDLIISNPPFFRNSFASKNTQRQIARHTDSLSYDDLLYSVKRILLDDGIFSVIIPFDSKNIFVEGALKNHLFLNRETFVFPNIYSTKAKRVLLSFSKKDTPKISDSLIIELNQRHLYSEQYKELTKDFYLNF